VVYGLERLASSCSGAELVQNPEDVATLARIGVPASKLTLVGNGVDFSRFHPDDTEPAALRAELAAMAGEGPAPVGLVAFVRYRTGAAWQLEEIGGAAGVLGLLANTVSARSHPGDALAASASASASASAAARGATLVEGARSEAAEAAVALLAMVGA